MHTSNDYRIKPSDLSPEIKRQLQEMVRNHERPSLVGPDGERIKLPDSLNDLLVFVVEAMQREQTLLLCPEDAVLTTQAAAEFLGMSRPYLLRLLDAGKLPFHRVGTHRRITLNDLLAYQAERDRERRTRLDALTEAIDAAGVYDRI